MKRNPAVSLECTNGVYSPAEDTLLLLDAIEVGPGERVLEVGTGSGFIAIHCALAGAVVVATDIDADAIRCARRSAQASGAHITLRMGDAAERVEGTFSLALFNPPYLPGEMGQRAVDGGVGGIEIISKFLRALPRLLSEGGRALIVLSSLSDFERLTKDFSNLVFKKIKRKRVFFEELAVYEVRVAKK